MLAVKSQTSSTTSAQMMKDFSESASKLQSQQFLSKKTADGVDGFFPSYSSYTQK
jgi:hypothetical protein